MWFSLEQLPYIAVTLIIAFTLHELAHAYVAYKFGDPTAARQGRLTLNPLKHLDPIGTILIFIAGFGWARPVPLNRFFFKNPRLAGVLVSVAGPLSNFLLVVLAYFFVYGMGAAGLGEVIPPFVFDFLDIFIWLNIILFVFNLLPFPPLDGYRIIEDLAPADVRAKMTQYENYGVVIFLILVITPLDQYTIQPIFSTVAPFLLDALHTFFQLFLR
jgi:Zn-dependent protease